MSDTEIVQSIVDHLSQVASSSPHSEKIFQAVALLSSSFELEGDSSSGSSCNPPLSTIYEKGLAALKAEGDDSDQVETARASGASSSPSTERKHVRVYVDGCFDGMHLGHLNLTRQARRAIYSDGNDTTLVVGLINDDEIVKNKGAAPIMNNEERYSALDACKWVDEIIVNAPYDLTEDWVNKLVNDYKIDYIVHGDDPCITADGKDAYAYAKSIGRYKQVKRTEGVSTTDIVGRMLLMTREHHIRDEPNSPLPRGRSSSLRSNSVHDSRISRAMASFSTNSSSFLPTARRIMQFAEGRLPGPNDRVVYISGAWDMFASGHIAALKEARKLGDFLLVGIHDDNTVNSLRGNGMPIMNLHERALSLLACKYVDEVIIGAPWVITEDLIKTMNISVVAKGTYSDFQNAAAHQHIGLEYDIVESERAVAQAYEAPERLGIVRTFESPVSLSALDIVKRIMDQREQFQKKFDKKSKMEAEYIANKQYVQEQ